jgi:hypothetical protein
LVGSGGTSVPGRVARFDWNGGPTRLGVTFDRKGPAKCTVAVAHERLPDADEAEKAKASWKARLAYLKSFLEPTAEPGEPTTLGGRG